MRERGGIETGILKVIMSTDAMNKARNTKGVDISVYSTGAFEVEERGFLISVSKTDSKDDPVCFEIIFRGAAWENLDKAIGQLIKEVEDGNV